MFRNLAIFILHVGGVADKVDTLQSVLDGQAVPFSDEMADIGKLKRFINYKNGFVLYLDIPGILEGGKQSVKVLFMVCCPGIFLLYK
ncbi:hypothetical protein SDC9_136090 [bioreactor metagenome]|uniref:Uncharacterized protein n=1 Tax=bioreactor metagenome TaxID=1076179 RepID=A0A645DK85_9ZZZZ